jgi:16S rRNA (guanine527-N7)-methyltransferase
MSEDEAREWLLREGVSRETLERLQLFVNFLAATNESQNLVSRPSLDSVWARHIVDSFQLARFAPPIGSWLDLGTGAGFPGLLVPFFHDGPVTLVESRRLRTDFLGAAAAVLGIGERVTIAARSVESLGAAQFEVISARAFAPLPRLLTVAERFAGPATRWILPKGRKAQSELDEVRGSWQGVFRIERSVTDPEAGIIVAEQVRRRREGKRAE